MSNINTNAINTSYPVPGVNNNTQGFRDNFTNITNNLDTAATEITDLQSKAIVKTGLNGFTLDNDMANTVISNAQTRSFRESMYDLGTNLSGNVSINVSNGDVQYGTIQADTTINFNSWMPAGTRGGVKLSLAVANANATITFPVTNVDYTGNITSGPSKSFRLLENYSSNNYPHSTGNSFQYTNQVTIPAYVSSLEYEIYSDDCGTTMDIVPLNRNYKSSHIEVRTPTNVGLPGDVQGQLCTNGSNLYVCVGSYDGSTIIWGYVALTAV
jgi:hypothetical protein